MGRVFDSLIFVGWKIGSFFFFFAAFNVFCPTLEADGLYFPSLFFKFSIIFTLFSSIFQLTHAQNIIALTTPT